MAHIIKFKEKVWFHRGLRNWLGFKQAFIKYEREKRKRGVTKFNFIDGLSLGLDGILSFSTRLLTIVMLFGFLLSMVSLFLIGFILYDKFILENNIPGYSATIITVSTFSGFIIFVLGLIGAYIERIFIEVKDRPMYIVNNVFEKKHNAMIKGNQTKIESCVEGVFG